MAKPAAGKGRKKLCNTWGFLTGFTAKRAEGLYVYSTDGKRYMDLTSGHAVTNIGHNHPAVVDAIQKQAGELVHAGSCFYYRALDELAEKLTGIAPRGFERVFLANSGAEAVEGALKLARYHTGRQGIISFTGGFHGRTFASISITTSNVHYRNRYHPLLPSVFRAVYPYCYRCMYDKHPGTCDTYCLNHLDYLFGQEIAPDEVAAIIIEPVLGEGGYVPAPKSFLVRLREICDEHGIMLIFDEVQSGVGRTCKWFALEHYGVVPDIITSAKGIASGMPLSAIISKPGIMDGWEPGAHGTTFGGNPVSCAAAVATIDTIKNEGLLAKSARVSAAMVERLKELQRDCYYIGDVRALGMMIGVEFVRDGITPYPEAVEKLKASCLKKGLMTLECGTHKNVIRFVPPLVTSMEQMEEAMGIFGESVRKL